MKGIRVKISKPSFGGCSNGGISSRYDEAIFAGSEFPEIEESLDLPVLFLDVKTFFGETHLRAVPEEDRGQWNMFGGCTVFSEDPRFPYKEPIKLFDRLENVARSV